MGNVGKAFIVAGLIGIEGIKETGCGWFTTSILLIIGTVLCIHGRKERYEKESSSNIIERDFTV